LIGDKRVQKRNLENSWGKISQKNSKLELADGSGGHSNDLGKPKKEERLGQ